MEQVDVADLTGRLDEPLALSDQGRSVELGGQHAAGTLREVTGHGSDRVGGGEGRTTLVAYVGPQHQGQQALLGRVEEVPEEVAVLVPAG